MKYEWIVEIDNDEDFHLEEAKWKQELVRCKDCKWFGKIEFFSYCYKLCVNKTIGFSEDGYCAWGERREDIEPVVRCKDCVYYNAREGFCEFLSNNYAPAVDMEENDFCSKGKRREDAEIN